MANGDNAPIWKVTRFCCTSGMCVECHTKRGHKPVGSARRVRIVHADNLTKSMAERMVAGWSAYDAKVEAM